MTQTLQARFEQGDVTVLDDIYAKFFPILYYRARLRFGLCREDAEDIVQTVFGKLTALIETGHANFAAWLNAVTDNECCDHRRREGYREAASLDASPSSNPEGDSLGSQIRDRARSAPEHVEGAELCQLVVACVDELREDERIVVWLRFRDGLSFQEIADILERRLGTVAARFRRALDKLRDCVQRKLSQHEADWPDLCRELGLRDSG